MVFQVDYAWTHALCYTHHSACASAGIDSELVTSVAASRYFSALATASGKVWTFGGGFNGELGHNGSWVTSARQVDGHVAQVSACIHSCCHVQMHAWLLELRFACSVECSTRAWSR